MTFLPYPFLFCCSAKGCRWACWVKSFSLPSSSFLLSGPFVECFLFFNSEFSTLSFWSVCIFPEIFFDSFVHLFVCVPTLGVCLISFGVPPSSLGSLVHPSCHLSDLFCRFFSPFHVYGVRCPLTPLSHP